MNVLHNEFHNCTERVFYNLLKFCRKLIFMLIGMANYTGVAERDGKLYAAQLLAIFINSFPLSETLMEVYVCKQRSTITHVGRVITNEKSDPVLSLSFYKNNTNRCCNNNMDGNYVGDSVMISPTDKVRYHDGYKL